MSIARASRVGFVFRLQRAANRVGLVTMFAGARPAHAGPPLVVLLPSLSELPKDLQQRLERAVSAGLQTMNLQAIGNAERDTILQSESSLAGCDSADCLERLGRLLGANAVVRYKVSVEGASGARRTYQLQVAYHNVEIGAEGARSSQSCSGCTQSDVAKLLQELIGKVAVEDAGRPRGRLNVETTPPNAVLFVDGNELGPTPYKGPAFAGPHNLLLRATGFLSQQAKVDVYEGKTARLALQLVSGSDQPVATTTEKPIYKKWWFWVAIGGAAVAAAAITAGVVVGTTQSSAPTGPIEPMRSPNHIAF
jgi:hypothetical protein